MKLLYTNRSPYARKVLVVAHEKDISLELVEEDLTSKSATLLAHNPLGKIPTLILDDGQSLCDSSLICEYLDENYKTPALIPRDIAKRRRILGLDALAKGLMDNAVAIFFERMIHPTDYNAQFIQSREQSMVRCLIYLDQQSEYFEELSMASISIAVAIGYLHFRHAHLWPQKGCQSLSKWYDNFSQRESMQQTIPIV